MAQIKLSNLKPYFQIGFFFQKFKSSISYLSRFWVTWSFLNRNKNTSFLQYRFKIDTKPSSAQF